MEPIKIMVIGLGQWGQLWVEDILSLPLYKIVALVDTNIGNINTTCSKFKLDKEIGFLDPVKGIETTKPNAALVVVPPEAHFSIAMQCIEHDLHVLSEKPLANNMDEALAIREAVLNRKVKFMVSQDYRWQPPIQALRKAISENVIGKVGYATYSHFQSLKIGGWREKMMNVLLEDMSIHHFDILRYIIGRECDEIYAVSFNPSWSWYTGGACVSASLIFEDSFVVNYFATWITTGPIGSWPGEIRIEGEKGALTMNNNGEVKLLVGGSGKNIKPPKMEYMARKYALKQFYDAIAKNQDPETNVEDNIKSYAMIQAALMSTRLHRPIRLKELL